MEMDLMEAMKERHSVRQYAEQKIEGEVLDALYGFIDERNRESGLHIQLCVNETTAFSGMMARYGNFKNAYNYIALVGAKTDDLEEKSGYYGQKIVLKAQQLGLNTCWVAATFSKGKSKKAITINPGERLLMVIAVGYSETQGVAHRSKPVEELYEVQGEAPEWFMRGIEAAQLAPTATNQQKFKFELEGNKVKAVAGSGIYTKVDLGIVKCHFEIGAGAEGWQWA